ncbi:aminotransferase class IV [Ancylobacter pratisalsi]|uniref:Probable branched-chain-amino-acid aminotransferase n=1 Tax=Ancylobacter pratisalsi TaxID=1745854 RepID=A0A6P1YR59_9HYPH|nr:aminotransferase class IV [Ancylobacter pratisalsi]QIB35380.1 class IV aminotransferase [Ancylobacter pratisalsi]
MSETISTQDRGFTLGDGLFDTALALGGQMLARQRHVARLLDAAHAIGIALDPARLDAALDAALTPEPAILRTTVTRGPAGRGLWPAQAGEPTLLVTTAPWTASLMGQPARLITATGRRNAFSPSANLKTLGYLDHILAAREAAMAGADDALILNTDGRVACSTIANVFVLIAGRLITPCLSEGCLPGIMRALVIEVAPALGLAIEERPVVPEALFGADMVLLTNSVRFLRPVTALDGTELARDEDVFDRVQAALLSRLTGESGVALPVR